MSHAINMISVLDRQVAKKGEAITYQAPGIREVSTPFRATVRKYKPGELQGGLLQGDSEVVISPTALSGAAIVEVLKGGRLYVSGQPRQIMTVTPVKLDDVIVRINVWVRG